jgi:hypothetical protein
MDVVTLFGLFAVTAMLVFYALEDRSPWFILAFAGACALASAYGFLPAQASQIASYFSAENVVGCASARSRACLAFDPYHDPLSSSAISGVNRINKDDDLCHSHQRSMVTT